MNDCWDWVKIPCNNILLKHLCVSLARSHLFAKRWALMLSLFPLYWTTHCCRLILRARIASSTKDAVHTVSEYSSSINLIHACSHEYSFALFSSFPPQDVDFFPLPCPFQLFYEFPLSTPSFLVHFSYWWISSQSCIEFVYISSYRYHYIWIPFHIASYQSPFEVPERVHPVISLHSWHTSFCFGL